MVFGFFKKKQAAEDEEIEIDPVSFLGPVSGKEVNLKPYGKLVDAGLLRAKDLVTDALARRAETLRVEPKGAQSAVTMLIDGIPYPGGKLSKQEGMAITQMLKLLAGLDPKERKSAQAAGIKAEFDGRPYILGVNSVPVAEGERLTLRINDQKLKRDTLEELGMSDEMRGKLRDICCGAGLVVACGPAGSGTTTTRFALVRNVDAYIYTILTIGNTEGRKLSHISALEDTEGDPLDATITRAVRREANVLLCDPLKDAESAKVMLDKCDNVMLITEMGSKDVALALLQLLAWSGEARPVAEGLKAIVTQKLIRLLCPDCRQAYKPKGDFLKKIGLPDGTSALYRSPPEGDEQNAEPCAKCGGVGYFGRTGMFEVLEMTDGMKELITGEADANTIRAQMKKDKMITLQKDGLRLVAEGRTSLEELQRVFKPA